VASADARPIDAANAAATRTVFNMLCVFDMLNPLCCRWSIAREQSEGAKFSL
jgi:hypothetical protein